MWVTAMTPTAMYPATIGEVAVRQVDDLHDPEHQRQPAGEQRVEAADQDSLDDGVDPGHNDSASSGDDLPRPPCSWGDPSPQTPLGRGPIPPDPHLGAARPPVPPVPPAPARGRTLRRTRGGPEAEVRGLDLGWGDVGRLGLPGWYDPRAGTARCDATRRAWLTSCSTSSTVSPVARICGSMA